MRLGVLIVAVMGLLALPSAAGAAVVDLASAPGSPRIDGQAPFDLAGSQVANAGDINGDGIADLIVGAHFTDNNGRTESGSAYVIYGGQNFASIDLQNLGAAGFRIDGAAAEDELGQVAGAGDINGDGIADLIVGASLADNNGRHDSGSAYVIYGQKVADPADVDLANITTTEASRGLRIDGAAKENEAGQVAGAGDINGDGIADLIVGAALAQNNGRAISGSAYVIYGQKADDPADVDLANITTTEASRGLRIDGAAAEDIAGSTVAGAGDINGDGIADLIVGARLANNNGRTDSGSAYVIYGQRAADPADLDLANIATTQASRGLRIDGAAALDLAGLSVAGAGDINGDGIADLVVGALDASNNGRTESGSTYVIYGQRVADPADLDLANIATTQASRGLRIDGAAEKDNLGFQVAGAGDINGDGIADLTVTAPLANNNGRTDSGSIYVIYGQRAADPADLDLANIATTQASRGLRIDGAAAEDEAGSVAGVGDINGDKGADLIVGAAGADNNGRQNSGSAYVLFGTPSPFGPPPPRKPFLPREPPPLPSSEFSFGKLKRNKKTGTAIQVVKVPGPGTLKLSGKGLFALARRAGVAGGVKLKIRASGGMQKELNGKGRVTLGARFTYTPTGGNPNTKVKTIPLFKKR
jgi:hypothetical protein